MKTIELRNAQNVADIGGKAANLARALALGFPVPLGFVIPRQFLDTFLQVNKLATPVSECLESYRHTAWIERIRRYETICNAVEAAPVPGDILEKAEADARGILESAPAGLAVRSSGISEDSTNAGFAGLYESSIGVRTMDELWRSVRRCWCSSWSPKVAAYAERMGIVLPIDGMAVLVQPVIAAESAGVIFTADPLTGDPWRFVMNATFGLACDLLDGSTAGDYFVLQWDTSEVLERKIVAKPTTLRVVDGSLQHVSRIGTEIAEAALSDAQLEAIGRMALEIDRAFGGRMDIEFAVASDGIHLIQARPLTALPPCFPHELSAEEAEKTMILSKYNSGAPIRPFARHSFPLEIWCRHLRPGDIFPRPRAKERFFNGYLYSTEWEWSGPPCSDDRTTTEHWLDSNEHILRKEWCGQRERFRAANRQADQAARDATRAVDWIQLALDYEREEDRFHAAVSYATQWLVFECDRLLAGFLEDASLDLKREGLPGELLQGLSCYSSERTQSAQRLGRSVTEDFVRLGFQQVPLADVIPNLLSRYPHCDFLKGFADFCRTFGVAAPGSGDGQDVEGLLLTIRSNLPGERTTVPSVEEMQAAAAKRRLKKEEEVRTHLRSLHPDQLPRFEKLLGWAQFWTPALDNRKWQASMQMRRDSLILQAGEALTREGLIDCPPDVWLLTRKTWMDHVENPDAAKLRGEYERSRHEYERDSRLVPPPYLGKPPRPAPSEDANRVSDAREGPISHDAASYEKSVLQGQGLASGYARGISSKVASLEERDYIDTLRSEHILVCGSDPHGAHDRRDWYSLLLVVRALVTVGEAGLHHATQIARECGTPFVNLTEDDLDAIPDGVPIEVDGRKGTVTILSE
jgi:phosphohistidine swiveling domain-containing protein